MKLFKIMLLVVATLFLLRAVYFSTVAHIYFAPGCITGQQFAPDWYSIQKAGDTVMIGVILSAGFLAFLFKKVKYKGVKD
jgi:hypothetical protein